MDLEALKVFPIPAQDQLIVEGEQTEIESFTLLNAQGTDVTHAVAFQKGHTPNTVILDLRALPAGVYLLQTALHTERVVLL
ncbi:MAG: hypothetical protein A3D92_21305 [Bacteroidetes bacterium RIFCSPHIGHO2_02_FULL_44_7]|nr:MAG: hypothetical protein A3D92_21305 [Bacteroidetes bacterium RIFCSPHIGHO2_02_FULL_44_7]